MKSFTFVTGNESKYLNAQAVCHEYGIEVVRKQLEISEIQSENPEAVALDKASKAFELTNKPMVITDDSWSIAGLNGFPGVYMHSMNAWLSPEDFLRLTIALTDRRVALTIYLVYKDSQRQKVFT